MVSHFPSSSSPVQSRSTCFYMWAQAYRATLMEQLRLLHTWPPIFHSKVRGWEQVSASHCVAITSREWGDPGHHLLYIQLLNSIFTPSPWRVTVLDDLSSEWSLGDWLTVWISQFKHLQHFQATSFALISIRVSEGSHTSHRHPLAHSLSYFAVWGNQGSLPVRVKLSGY